MEVGICMKIKNKFICVIMAVMLLVSGCGGGSLVAEKETKRPEATGSSWTVMLYIPGGMLEEEYGKATEVLSSLSYNLPENINVVVETGGCRKWNSEGIKNDRIQDFIVQENGIKPIYESLMKNMGESDTYEEYISRSVASYPADHYVSIIWGQGGGPLAGATTDSTYHNDPLTVKEISDGLAGAGVMLDIIGFDGSMMSTIETAASLSLYANYLVASEDILPAGAWDYRGLFELLSNAPETTPDVVAASICEQAYGWSRNNDRKDVCMAVIDLAKATVLIQGFETLARHMSESTLNINSLCAMEESLKDVFVLGARGEVEGYSELVDVGSMADCVFDATSDDSARLDNILEKAVIYCAKDEEATHLSGLGVFYPMDKHAANISVYRVLSPSMGYMEYLDRVNSNALVSERVADYSETESWAHYELYKPYNSISAYFEPTGIYTLSVVSPELIAKAAVNVYKYDEELGKYMLLMTDYNTTRDNLSASFVYEFENTVFEMNGTPVWAELVKKTDSFMIYSIPVIYNDAYSSIWVKKTINKNKADYKVIGIWSGVDNQINVQGRIFKKIDTGDVITPVYRTFGGDMYDYIEGKSLRLVFGGANISEKAVSDGDYMISYTTEDVYGEKVESNTTNVSAVKGKLKLSN